MTKGGILVFVELHRGNAVHGVSFELLGKGRSLANAKGCELFCLALTDGSVPLDALCHRGADTVYVMTDAAFANPEEALFKANIVPFIQEHEPEVVLFGATAFGRSLAPRVAAALGTGLTADCTDLRMDDDGRLIQIRPAFADNLFAHIKTRTLPQMATIRHKEFDEAEADLSRPGHIVDIPPAYTAWPRCNVLSKTRIDAYDITEAEVIVAGGRGIRKAEDIALLERLAEAVGGRVGFSRALVDAGLVSSRFQIGYSGHRVKPRIYIACGISGAPQHIAGMKESGRVIAINTDASAPIFNLSDVAYVGDMYQIIPMLIGELSRKEAAVK